MTTNQGSNETIVVTNTQGTGDAAIALTSTVGGVEITGKNSTLTMATAGDVALTANTDGQYNTAIGDGALKTNQPLLLDLSPAHFINESLEINLSGSSRLLRFMSSMTDNTISKAENFFINKLIAFVRWY